MYMFEYVYQYDDGGRGVAGYKGLAGDCAVRAIAIATGAPYKQVYDEINRLGSAERIGKRKRSKSNARTGVYRQAVDKYMQAIGWKWTPTMFIGSGCKVHLRKDELPLGNIIARVSKHYVAVLDGVIHDTHNPARDGTRCVYGYFTKDERSQDKIKHNHERNEYDKGSIRDNTGERLG